MCIHYDNLMTTSENPVPLESASLPEVQIYVAKGCPHCQTVLNGLQYLMKEGRVRRIDARLVDAYPDEVAAHNIQAAPVTFINELRFDGMLTPGELKTWLEAASEADSGWGAYLREELRAGRLDMIQARVLNHEPALLALVGQLADRDAGLTVQLGIDVLFEAQAATDTGLPESVIDALLTLLNEDDPAVRGDAIHQLRHTRLAARMDMVRTALNQARADANALVAEAAEETLRELSSEPA
jgi:glutaredoxin